MQDSIKHIEYQIPIPASMQLKVHYYTNYLPPTPFPPASTLARFPNSKNNKQINQCVRQAIKTLSYHHEFSLFPAEIWYSETPKFLQLKQTAYALLTSMHARDFSFLLLLMMNLCKTSVGKNLDLSTTPLIMRYKNACANVCLKSRELYSRPSVSQPTCPATVKYVC